MTRNHREPNYAAALRIVELIRRLAARMPTEAPLDVMADEIGVHHRTLRRYASALSADAEAAGSTAVLRVERRRDGPVIVLDDPDGHLLIEQPPMPSSLPVRSEATNGPPASLRDLAVRFGPRVRREEAARRWGGTTIWVAGDDGSHTLRVKAVIDETLIRWLVSFGPSAEVLTPSALREEVADRLIRAADIYR